MWAQMADEWECVRAWWDMRRVLDLLAVAKPALVNVVQASVQARALGDTTGQARGAMTDCPAVRNELGHTFGGLSARVEGLAVLGAKLLAAGKVSLPRCPAAGKSATKRDWPSGGDLQGGCGRALITRLALLCRTTPHAAAPTARGLPS